MPVIRLLSRGAWLHFGLLLEPAIASALDSVYLVVDMIPEYPHGTAIYAVSRALRLDSGILKKSHQQFPSGRILLFFHMPSNYCSYGER